MENEATYVRLCQKIILQYQNKMHVQEMFFKFQTTKQRNTYFPMNNGRNHTNTGSHGQWTLSIVILLIWSYIEKNVTVGHVNLIFKECNIFFVTLNCNN